MSAPISPSSIVRAQVLARLADKNVGFNKNYAATVANYQGALPLSFDFGPRSQNFFQGRIDPSDIIETGTFTLPLMLLYATAGSNQNTQKFQRFAGPLRIGVEVWLSQKASQALKNFEAWPDAVEDAMINTINQAAVQNWPKSIVYNGQIGYERRPVAKAGENWFQAMLFQLTFQVVEA